MTWMISWEVDGVEMDCGAIVDGCCPKRKDRRIDLLDTEIEVIISVYYFSSCLLLCTSFLFYPFVLDFRKGNIGDKILQVLLHSNSKEVVNHR